MPPDVVSDKLKFKMFMSRIVLRSLPDHVNVLPLPLELWFSDTYILNNNTRIMIHTADCP